MDIKKFNEFLEELNESTSLEMESDWYPIIKETPELSSLISKRKIEIKDNKIFFDGGDEETIDTLKTYLGIDLPEEK